jgi:hypothetical protein
MTQIELVAKRLEKNGFEIEIQDYCIHLFDYGAIVYLEYDNEGGFYDAMHGYKNEKELLDNLDNDLMDSAKLVVQNFSDPGEYKKLKFRVMQDLYKIDGFNKREITSNWREII